MPGETSTRYTIRTIHTKSQRSTSQRWSGEMPSPLAARGRLHRAKMTTEVFISSASLSR